jgi:hypothetical protein
MLNVVFVTTIGGEEQNNTISLGDEAKRNSREDRSNNIFNPDPL